MGDRVLGQACGWLLLRGVSEEEGSSLSRAGTKRTHRADGRAPCKGNVPSQAVFYVFKKL